MKKEKESLKERLLDALIEILLAVLCLGIGILILHLFGVDVTAENVDFELIILLGLAVSGIVFVVGYVLFRWIKKKLNRIKKGE